MSALIIRKPNGIDNADLVKVRYRLLGSVLPYAEAELSQSQFPYTAEGVQSGLYELGIQQRINGVWSDWAVGTSDACSPSTQFTVIRNGSNFDVLFTIAPGQEKYQVELTDPNNGKALKSYEGEGSGSVSIPIVPFIEGQWKLRLRGICDDSVTPPFASEFTEPVFVQVGSACNPPVITGDTEQDSNDTTITQRITFTGYSTNVRIRVVDVDLESEIRNDVIAATGTVDVILFKNKTYAVQIFNICSDGNEQSDSVDVDTNP